MSSRGRAIAFASAAAVCAGLAAAASTGRQASLDAQLGELAPALVTLRALPARQRLDAKLLRDAVEERRVPRRFLPPGALSNAAQLEGRRLVATLSPGSYVLASQIRVPGERTGRRFHSLEPGRRPVEITVGAAGSITGGGGRRSVDVIVTSEPGPGGGPGKTYVAAEHVALLDLRPVEEAGVDPIPGPASDSWVATLALTRAEALRLIQAESFARSIRLLSR